MSDTTIPPTPTEADVLRARLATLERGNDEARAANKAVLEIAGRFQVLAEMAHVEAEEFRTALHSLVGDYEQATTGATVAVCENVRGLSASPPCGACRYCRARALLARPPTVAALRAREALAVLAWIEALASAPSGRSERADALGRAYLAVRAAREAAEKETTP